MSRSTSETVADTNTNNNNNSNRLNVNSYSSSLTSSPSPGSASIITSNATGSHQLNNTTSLTTPNGALANNSNTISHLNSTSYASSAANTTNTTPQTSHTLNSTALTNSEKKKIGHREVKHGIVLYKKVPTDELKKSIQFGIVHFINKMDRDLLMQDFQVVENIVFPRAGSQCTPAHDFNDFKLKVYAPYGFKYLRRKFNLNEVDFMVSYLKLVFIYNISKKEFNSNLLKHALGETDLIEISNPGASGSVFYKTSNDKYILKTVQYQECEFLKTLLAGYALVSILFLTTCFLVR
jgi:hypothetical protein